MTQSWDLLAYKDLIDLAEAERKTLLAQAQSRAASGLPLKFLRQQAHFTTPASNYDMVQKAVEKGCGGVVKNLEKFNISLAELSDTLAVELRFIEEVLAGDPQSPLVMVDGEDAQALRDDVVLRGRENAIRVFREAQWGRTLRFYRPSGLNLKYCVEDIFTVLTQAAQGLPPEKYPIDGIIWPKSEHPEQIEFVCRMLAGIEDRLGLKPNQIRLQFLVESGFAAAQLPLLVRAATHRLAGIIWGIADYSADIGLPHIINDHPVCDWARAVIINMAGAAGVPAIDNMTVNYPVAAKNLTEKENRALILARLKECYDDARHGQALGMDGKWVGHPLQLFVVRLAYRAALPEDEIAAEVRKIEAYLKAVEAEQGATIIEGVMSDRATDRHARQKLRKAIAIGHLSAAKGLELGLITPTEAAQLAGRA